MCLQTGRSKGFGFVYFKTVDDAQKAREACNGMVLHDSARVSHGPPHSCLCVLVQTLEGRKIRCDYSVTKKPHVWIAASAFSALKLVLCRTPPLAATTASRAMASAPALAALAVAVGRAAALAARSAAARALARVRARATGTASAVIATADRVSVPSRLGAALCVLFRGIVLCCPRRCRFCSDSVKNEVASLNKECAAIQEASSSVCKQKMCKQKTED